MKWKEEEYQHSAGSPKATPTTYFINYKLTKESPGVFCSSRPYKQYLTKILSQNVSRIPSSVNVVWFDFVILYCIPNIVILDVNMFGPFFLYWVGVPEEWSKVITIEVRDRNIKTNFTQEIWCPDELAATIREHYILDLSGGEGYWFLFAT